MSGSQIKKDWCIWMIILSAVSIILIHLSKVILLFRHGIYHNASSNTSVAELWIVLLPLINILFYPLFLSVKGRGLIGKKLNRQQYYRLRLLTHFCISFAFTGLFLSVFGIELNEMFLVRFSQLMLVFFIGYFMQYIKPNREVGLRVTWTLSNEAVWKKTHGFVSKFWTAFSAYAMLVFPTIGPDHRNIFLIVFFVLLIVPPVVYSYRLSLKADKKY